jgi:hypothetical protein
MTRELVDALIAGDSIAIEDSLNTTMSQKISKALDDYRTQVAQKMFVKQEEQPSTEEDVNTEQA